MRQSKIKKKKEDNLNYLFINKPTFRRLIPSFFRALKSQWKKSNLTFCWEWNTIYELLFLPLREETEGNDKLDFLHWLFKTLKKDGISLRNVGLWIKRLFKLSSFFWILDCLINIHSITHYTYAEWMGDIFEDTDMNSTFWTLMPHFYHS